MRLVVAAAILLAACLAQQSPSRLAHIAGSSRKIRMYVKNFYLSLGPDGKVSGLPDDTAPQTVLQRSSVTVGKVKIQGVTTCMYLCMDICGSPYASREFSEECVFNEMIEENHYNSYSSAKYSNGRRTLYLGLNRRGQARRVVTRGGALGRQSTYARVLTTAVQAPPKSAPCPPAPTASPGPARCRLRLRRRRKRKRCREPGCPLRRRKSRLELRRIRHRKHRTLDFLPPEDEVEEDEEEEDLTMTMEEEDEEPLLESRSVVLDKDPYNVARLSVRPPVSLPVCLYATVFLRIQQLCC